MISKEKEPCSESESLCPTSPYHYCIVRENLRSEELGDYVSYGIRVYRGEEEVAFVSDVCGDSAELERLTALCTERGLDMAHLSDVIEDFLAAGGLYCAEE